MTLMKFRKSMLETSVTTTIFLVMFIIGILLVTRDYTNSFGESSAKAEILEQVDAVEKAYFGISPFWLKRFNITISEAKDLLVDNDGDGLNLKQEYEYSTDPTNPDSDGDGYTDGREVTNGYSPTGEGRLDANKNAIVDSWEVQYEFSLSKDEANEDTDGDGLKNREEYMLGTNPRESDTDKDGYSDGKEIANGYDPSLPGEARMKVEVIVKKINVVVPVVLSDNSSEKSLESDLENGAIRYPKTATPGYIGNAVISGHSSNYAWAKGQYNYIFKDLGNLEINDAVRVKNTLGNGRIVEYSYRVTEKFISTADDPRIFEETKNSTMTLVTCWPLNTDWKRLVVKTELL